MPVVTVGSNESSNVTVQHCRAWQQAYILEKFQICHHATLS
jgi:hypothetical protein